MTHPLRASRAPSRGPSPDMEGPAGLASLARSQGASPGAACKARQRPGEAGSAAFTWLQRRHAQQVAAITVEF